MTKLLQEAIEKVHALPDERQDEAAEILLAMVAQSAPETPRLTDAQADVVRTRLADTELATDEEVTAFYQKAGA